jgi:hypothetical protein
MTAEGIVTVCVVLAGGTVSEARGTVCVDTLVIGVTGFVTDGVGATVGCGVGRAVPVCGGAGETVTCGVVVRGRISCGAGRVEGGYKVPCASAGRALKVIVINNSAACFFIIGFGLREIIRP